MWPFTSILTRTPKVTRREAMKSVAQRNRARLSIEGLETRATPAIFTVNVLADTPDANVGNGVAQDAAGNTSLRAAIHEANGLGGDHQINFQQGLAGTITLAVQLYLNANIAINGPGSPNLTVNLAGGVAPSPLFSVEEGMTCSISNLTAANGGGRFQVPEAGAIHNKGVLGISGVVFQSNEASAGAIYNAVGGWLEISASIFSDNWGLSSGGALANYGHAVVTTTDIFGNHSSYGGGIYNHAGATLTIASNTRIFSNQASSGGGIYNDAGATLNIQGNTEISSNIATGHGGGIYNEGQLTMMGGELSSNSVLDWGTENGQDGRGGGLYSRGTATLTDVLIEENWAQGRGGGVYVAQGTTTLTTCTVLLNTADSNVGEGAAWDPALATLNDINSQFILNDKEADPAP